MLLKVLRNYCPLLEINVLMSIRFPVGSLSPVHMQIYLLSLDAGYRILRH
jgi:hypothetical protein